MRKENIMETTITNKTAAVAAGDTPDPETIAKQLLDVVTTLESLVPGFTPHNPREIRRVAAGAKFAHELIGPTITTVTSVAAIQQRNLFDVARGQEALRYRDAIRPIAQRLAAFTSGLEFTIDSKLFAAGDEALGAYKWAKRYANSPSGDALRPYVEEMTRVVKKTINRTKKPATPPATPPTPPAHTLMAADAAEEGKGNLPKASAPRAEDVK
jgi:hypothetical protein